MTRATNPLSSDLGPNDAFDQLTAEEAEQLHGLLKQAKQAEQRNLDAAIDEGLDVLPRLVRIPARKILFGR